MVKFKEIWTPVDMSRQVNGPVIKEVYYRGNINKDGKSLFRGFQYDVVGLPKKEKFYGVGCRTFWYQWNEPNDN